jgi:hypothetical protein
MSSITDTRLLLQLHGWRQDRGRPDGGYVDCTIFRDSTQCSSVDRYQRFGAIYCIHVQIWIIYQNTRRHFPECNSLHSFCRESPKSYKLQIIFAVYFCLWFALFAYNSAPQRVKTLVSPSGSAA